jgi:hypothetical protein
MKKLMKILLLFAGVLMLSNCVDDDNKNNIVYFFDEPAVITSLNEGQGLIYSPHASFEVSFPDDSSLKTGDLLWTAFVVNLDEKAPMSSADSRSVIYKTTNFSYQKVDSSKVIIPADATAFHSYLSDEYTAFIHEAVLYKDYLDKLLFFGFRRDALSENLILDYEIVLNPEIEAANKYPTLYIRSKKIETTANTSAGRPDKNETVFAFDMTEYIDYYRKNISSSGVVGFNLKYKTGVDEEGNDTYREFRSNPIKWDI